MAKIAPFLMHIIVLCVGSTTCIPCLEAIKYTPGNLVIATDLDDVLLSWNKGGMVKTAFKDIHGLKKYYKQTKKRHKLTGSFGHKYGESLYIDALENGDLKAAHFLRDIANQKHLKKHTLHIYQELTEAGYLFYTATNIGSLFFEDLQNKFPYIFNDAFIKHGLTVDYSVSDIIEKPDFRYYHKLNEKLNPSGEKYILFIDDRKENVVAARNFGMQAIQYKNHKQLVHDLHAYNICLCSGTYKAI